MNDYIITFQNEYREQDTVPMSADTLIEAVESGVLTLLKYDKEHEIPIHKYQFITAIKL